jgi:hypothetical protein
MVIATAYLLSGGRLFRNSTELPNNWQTFVVPDGGFTVRFPTATPTEEDLTLYLFDSEHPDSGAREWLIRNFITAGGTVRGWSAEDGSTRYSVRVLHTPPQERAVGEQVRTDLGEQKSFAPILTNLPVIEERRTVSGELKGRLFLVARYNGNRILTYFFYVNDCGIFLFAERMGESLTMEDPAARSFFRSVVLLAK